MESAATFKCVIVGDKGVGKTTFIRKHALGEAARTTDGTLLTSSFVVTLIFSSKKRNPLKLLQ